MSIRKHGAIMDLMNGIEMRLGYVGYAVVDQKWKTTCLATPFNRLYLIESGTGILYTERESIVLTPGSVYLLPAGLPCSYHCADSMSLLFFHFNIFKPDQVDLMRNVEHLSVVGLQQEQLVQLRALCENPSYSNAFTVICSLNDIMLEMMKKYRYSWNAPPSYSPCVNNALFEINKHLSAQLRVDTLARKCYISQSYLSRQFHRETGITLKKYIEMQLVNAAQWKLSNTDDSVEKISSDLNFCNQFYFSEFFKKHCRVSPLQYRNGTKY